MEFGILLWFRFGVLGIEFDFEGLCFFFNFDLNFLVFLLVVVEGLW